MPMSASDIERLIRAALPDARISIRELAADGDHYAAEVVSEQFRGKSRVQQHQMVYEALKGNMGGALHALGAADERAGLKGRPRPAQENEMTAINEWIDSQVKANDVVLFMKGTPTFPQCGFSGQVVQILDYLGVHLFRRERAGIGRAAPGHQGLLRTGRPSRSST